MSRFQVEVSIETHDFIRRQPPEPRRLLREGLRKLAREEGEIKALQGDLEGYFRMRIGHFRAIFRYESGTLIRCLLIERRALVYEVFSSMVKDRLREGSEETALKRAPRPASYAKPKRKRRAAAKPSAGKVVQ